MLILPSDSMLEEKKFHSLNALGLALAFIGNGVFFYFRSMVIPSALYQASTLAFLVCAILLAQTKLPYHLFQRFNSSLAWTFLSFFLITQCYFILYSPLQDGFVRDLGNSLIFVLFLFTIFRLDDEIQPYLLDWIVWISLGSSLVLIYSFFTNPELVVGSRASVTYGDQSGANPQLYSKIAFIGLISTFTSLKFRSLSSFKRIFYSLCFLLSALGILFTQVRTTILVLFLVGPIMLLLTGPTSLFKLIFSWKTLLFIFGIYFSFNILFDLDLLELIAVYYAEFSKFTIKALETIFTFGKTENVDSSANSRLELLRLVQQHFEQNPHTLLFGNGYRFLYVDVPVAEVLVSFGIGGLIHYMFFTAIGGYYAFQAIFSKHYFQVFLGLLFLYQTVTQFTQGAPLDIYYLLSMAIFIRFLGLKNESPNLNG